MQTNPVWRMVRALIATYILSGILRSEEHTSELQSH